MEKAEMMTEGAGKDNRKYAALHDGAEAPFWQLGEPAVTTEQIF